MSPLDYIRSQQVELTAIRRDLHAHPELGFEEHRTAEIVSRELDRLGIEYHNHVGKTGVVGVIRGERDNGRAVGLRADMDALPIVEASGVEYASQSPGRMHACGHDGHTTMLLGAARYLAATRRFSGTVFLIFQPGEEGFAGGKAMVEEGLFERFPADEIYALHNWPALPPGTIAVRPGPMMAAADRIEIHIEGRGGHGAHPHMSVDPVLVAGYTRSYLSVADELIGPENVVRDLEPSMGSEDFSFMLQQRPGAYARLGQGGAEGGCFLHNSRYDFNDEVIPLGAGYMAALAEHALPLAR